MKKLSSEITETFLSLSLLAAGFVSSWIVGLFLEIFIQKFRPPAAQEILVWGLGVLLMALTSYTCLHKLQCHVLTKISLVILFLEFNIYTWTFIYLAINFMAKMD